MGLTTTNALITVQDGAGALQAPAAGAIALFTPGSQVSFALASTTGVLRWSLSFECPAYPALHQVTFDWTAGQSPIFTRQMPAVSVSSTNPLAGIQIVSTVSDGVSSIATTYNFLQTRGQNTVPMQHFARAVQVAALSAYTNVNGVLTENANGAISTADGVTLAVGDLIVLPPGIAASAVDAGLYQVTSLGGASAKWVLTAAPDWAFGAQVMPKTEFLVSEGTLYAGTTWVVTNTGLTNTIGTTSFTMYPRFVSQSITLVAGTKTITNVPILSATAVAMRFTRTTANTTASTIDYQPVGTITTGALGTATFAFDAVVAAGTINAADISTGSLAIWNQV